MLNAGGRALATPFGMIYSTNITPDPETGIGAWSYPAFERAMREGIHRDGTASLSGLSLSAFCQDNRRRPAGTLRVSDGAAAGACRQSPHQLAFPFNWRPLLAGWNALFHRPGLFEADAAQSATWNRGAYLVEGLGHCGACHSPRNALGAEKAEAYLAGGFAEGWEAPPLTSLSHAPIPWSEDELYAYLRTGESRFHGVAAGPMAPVVKELAALPDEDIRAMAVYLGSFQEQRHRQAGAGRAGGQTRNARPVHGSPPRPAWARGSMKGPARFATRSAAPRCSAAGHRSR